MARKRGGGGGEGANWMDTYGDLVTLLLCFFVLLYAMSSMDETKWQYIAQAFAGGKGEIINVVVNKDPNPENDPKAVYVDESKQEDAEEIDFDEFYLYLSEAVKSQGLEASVSVELADTGVYMKFRDSVFFEGNSYKLLDEGKFILEVICDGVRAANRHVLAVKVNGHTAASAGSDANEWELSSGRASSVINYMLSLDCCEADKFIAAGYGKYRPFTENDTPEGKRQNRRVEIVFVRNDIDFSDPAVLNELMTLEFGKSFISESNADGDTHQPGEFSTPEEEKTYLSKDEYERQSAE